MFWSLDRSWVIQRESRKGLPTISLVWWASSQKRSYFLNSRALKNSVKVSGQTGNASTRPDINVQFGAALNNNTFSFVDCEGEDLLFSAD